MCYPHTFSSTRPPGPGWSSCLSLALISHAQTTIHNPQSTNPNIFFLNYTKIHIYTTAYIFINANNNMYRQVNIVEWVVKRVNYPLASNNHKMIH